VFITTNFSKILSVIITKPPYYFLLMFILTFNKAEVN